MTPAINLLKKKKVEFNIHSYSHDPSAASYGEEAAELLGLPITRVFKTLLVSTQGKPNDLAVAVVPVAGKLNLKSMAAALKAKKLEMADPQIAQKVTGYLVGGISPLGQKKSLRTVIDSCAQDWETIYVSAGRRGLEIELSAENLAQLTRAEFFDIARD